MTKLTVESANLTHFDELLSLVNDFDQALLFEKSPAYEQHQVVNRNRKQLKKYLIDNKCCYLLCRRGHLLIAYSFLSIEKRKKATTGYINELFVKPDERGNRVGLTLLQASLAWLREQPCHSINLTVHEANKAAIRLYEKAGFTTNHYINMSLSERS